MKSEKKLHLTLRKQWFDMIDSGEKLEEYREIKEYWGSRLLHKCISPTKYYTNMNKTPMFREFSSVVFYYGCAPSTKFPHIEFESPVITIGRGNPEWGAPVDKDVFIIRFGRRVE